MEAKLSKARCWLVDETIHEEAWQRVVCMKGRVEHARSGRAKPRYQKPITSSKRLSLPPSSRLLDSIRTWSQILHVSP